MKSKTETIEEFLARGGKITKVEYKQPELKEHITRQTSGGPATILSLGEAELFYGEAKAKKAITKNKVDMSALPEALRNKFINKLSEEVNLEEGDDE